MNSTNDPEAHQRVAQKREVESALFQGLSQATNAGVNQRGAILMEFNATDNISFGLAVLGKQKAKVILPAHIAER